MSKFLVGSGKAASDLCAALGLSSQTVVAFELHVRAGEMALLKVESLVLEGCTGELMNFFNAYQLVEVELGKTPRYTLPPEVMPGVPWPPYFRNEFNHWSMSFLGHTKG